MPTDETGGERYAPRNVTRLALGVCEGKPVKRYAERCSSFCASSSSIISFQPTTSFQ
ncbi:Uncharacterised protein [Serratia odorifera]|uniref:Uncharacterized protein n=1 Tax=Serratia odorifera TaxID=618 RepID=A0A447KTR9_SEROD|nr:Uncharacterised protein [Serratia odorifera]